MISCALILILTGCSTQDWQTLLGNWFDSLCTESNNCERICPSGDRPVGPVGTC